MRFNKLDLNLLVALDVLLKERSVTRAADLLHMSPSAMSTALAKLREYFDDELLVQIGRKMEVTPRAESLREAVRDVLLRVDTTIATQPAFEPRSSDRTFRIFASDYTQLVFVPSLLALAHEAGCTARFHFVPQIAHPHRELERGEADLLIIPTGFMSPDHPHEVLYHEDFVCMVWRGSKLAREELTFERYVQGEHAVMQPAGGTADTFESWFLKRYGVTRRIAVMTYSFVTVPAMVVGTELIATVHRRIAQRLAPSWPLEIRPVPLPIERMEQSVQWHKFRARDPGLVWLRDLAARAAKRMDAVTEVNAA
jgi:DNA-binding transcriptional LysR family regulator